MILIVYLKIFYATNLEYTRYSVQQIYMFLIIGQSDFYIVENNC